MTIYFLNLFLIGVYSFLYNYFKENRVNTKKFFVALVTINLFLILALRHQTIGVDIDNYLIELDFAKNASFSELVRHRFEMGYLLFSKFFNFNNEQIFLAIIAAVSVVPTGYFIYKNSKMPFLSFFLYIALNFYTFIFSGLRQAIAIAILCNSYRSIKERKLLKFLCFVIAASLFHQSALFFIPAYFVYKIKLTRKNLSILALFWIFIFIIRRNILEFVIKYIYSKFQIVDTGAYEWFFFNLLIFGICLLFYQDTVKNDFSNNGLYSIVGTGIALMVFATVSTNAMRVVNYYCLFIILLLPEVLSTIKNTKLKLLANSSLVFGSMILYWWFLYKDSYYIVPYQFFWQ